MSLRAETRRALLVRADADAQEIRNTWLGEMPDENVPLPQAGLKRYTRLSLVPGKNEIGLGRQDLEVQRFEFGDEAFPAGDDFPPACLEPRLILDRRRRGELRQTIERIGIETVLDPLQRLDQRPLSQREADAQTCKRTGFRQGLNDKQIGMRGYQRDGAFTAEIDIGLVHDDDCIRMGGKKCLDAGKRQADAGRRIRIGDGDCAAWPVVIRQPDLEPVVDRHLDRPDTV